MSYILTRTGGKPDIFAPDADQVDLESLAKSLAKQCRFTGHCRGHWSVARHSLLVADILASQGHDERVQLYGLLHDAAEAVFGDIHTPLKRLLWVMNNVMTVYLRTLEADWMRVLERKYAGVSLDEDGDRGAQIRALVKTADLIALATEKRDLMPADDQAWEVLTGIEPLADRTLQPDAMWLEGYMQFLTYYRCLTWGTVEIAVPAEYWRESRHG